METAMYVLMDRRMSIVTVEFCTLVYVNSRKMKTRLGEVLRLSSARISFVGHCDRFFEKEEKALYVALSFGNRLSWHHTGWCIRTCGRRQSNHRPHISYQACLPSTMHTAIQTPSQLSAITQISFQ